jgi:flavin prenyltransferase
MTTDTKKIVVAVCGASGVIYATRLLQALLVQPVNVHLIVSDTGAQVMAHELDLTPAALPELLSRQIAFHPDATLELFDVHTFFAPPASGSFVHDGMAVVPCSMKTLACIASGIADNLILRCADVCLKEKRRLIIVPRETPLNTIHLNNMLRAGKAGAVLLPAMPSFYSNPETINDIVDTVVARILDHLAVSHELVPRWEG